ncbi:hypothetical protein [Occallatibacter riparius]|uniref:Uncharacterized protein n=1 Tax=Occallatibacter riparius TaxID=1002689 RepID=A0A9J7BJ62_9BACT|nr:hypothetical protein [Occallatibacter riparius]UWZ82719.1 hypothetical protein MOP44_19370 [Occallatibacter riparius]
MRRVGLLLCVLLIGIPAVALEKVSVQGLEERLSGWHKDSDKKIATRLSNFTLTERLSTARLERMSAALPGDKSRMALLALADASAFLIPPAAEIPTDPAPEMKVQGEILTRAVEFVGRETERLPNFIATRKTTRFQDTKNVPNANIPEYFTPGVFHLLDRNSAQVQYIGWMEAEEDQRWGGSHGPAGWVTEDPESAATFRPSRMGLTMQGIFGPLLAHAMRDIVESKVGWSRWERSAAGKVAVLRFAIDKNDSTYYLKWCCYMRPGGGMNEFEAVPPYHGEIAVEPETGKVVRLTIMAELEKDAPITRAGIVVEYGPIEIGGKSYFLPLKGISTMLVPATHAANWTQTNYEVFKVVDKFPVTAVNDIRFEKYQVFRGELRIVPESGEPPAQ